jgi:hypothetical protein
MLRCRMLRCRMLRSRMVRCRVLRFRWHRLLRQLGVAVAGSALLAACAPAIRYTAPSGLRQYQILIDRDDSLARAVGQGLKRRGFEVRDRVQGGGPPTAYLLSFTMRDVEPGSMLWLYVRLADTRTGAIVAAVSALLDSLGSTPEARAQAIVDSLTRQPP